MKLTHLPEPPLEFGETLSYDVFDPAYGLQRLGPYDRSRRQFDSVQVVAVGPNSQKNIFDSFWNNLQEGVERQSYEPDYGGLNSIYRLESSSLIQAQGGYISVDNFQGGTEDQYRSALTFIKENCDFDVVYIIEPEQPIHYLHDLLKRTCIRLGLYSQYIEMDTLRNMSQGSVLSNVAVATYVKAGGVPWRVKHPTVANSCILGLSFHLASKDSRQRTNTIVGVAEVLDEFGQHLNMRVSQATVAQEIINQFDREFHSLYVPKDLMESLVKSALEPAQWPGRIYPQRMVIHKTSAFHTEEISGIQSALEELEVDLDYALIHVKEETIHRVYRQEDKSALRGVLLTLREEIPEAVLWTVGKVPFRYWDSSKRGYTYFEKSGSRIGTSDPIAIYLDPASQYKDFTLVDAAKQVLAMTKMRWNTFDLSIRIPASIYLARQVGNFVASAQRHNADMSFIHQVDSRHFW